jgi:hypothetical protein
VTSTRLRILAVAAAAALALPSCRKAASPPPHEQPVVLGPPIQIDYCTPEINRRMTECVPTCGPCELRGGGHVCRFSAGDDQTAVSACIDRCRKAAESICPRSP